MQSPEDKDARSGLVLPRLMIVSAAVLWSTSGFFVKHPTFDSWPAESRGLLLAFWRAFFAGILLLPFARRPRFRPQLVPMAFCFVLMNATYLSAMSLTTAANAIWLQNTAPMWVFLVSVFVLRERVKRDDLVLLIFGMLGVGTILFCELRAVEITVLGKWGVVLGLLSGVAYAGIVVFVRSMRAENSTWLISLNLLITAAVLLPFVVSADIWPTPTQLLFLACFGLFQMGLPYVLFAISLRAISSQEAAGIVLLEPILVPLWILHVEVPAWWTLLGALFILTGLSYRLVRVLTARANPA